MLLRHLLRALPEAHLTGAGDVEIVDIAYDSRRVLRGSLFVAVPTVGGDARSGGYLHVDEAVDRGAVAVVTQVPGVPARVPVATVANARIALSALASAFFEDPSSYLRVFAVTGTDGKTTTTYLLDGIFTSTGFTTGIIGTVATKIGDKRAFNAGRMTTPESLDLQRLLRSMVDAGVTHVAVEASSHALALGRLVSTRVVACAVTNITGDHVEFHGSWDAYVAAKASLISDIGRGVPSVLNMDDPSYDRLAALATGGIVSYGLDPRAKIRATRIQPGRWSTSFTLSIGGDRAPVTLPIPGSFNVSNAMAAAGLAHAAGIPPEAIARGLSTAQPPPGRMQRVAAGQDFDVLVDYAHTPNAFRSVLADLRLRSGNGRVIAVFGAAGDRDRSKRPLFAKIARDYADYFIITNEDPFGEDAARIISEVASGADSTEEGLRFEREPDRRRAIERAIALARKGDTIVILGKGHEQSIVVNAEREIWNDGLVARELLEAAR